MSPNPSPPPISVTLITLNEEAHIVEALRSVSWADERLVVDSGSSDRTVALAQAEGARTIVQPWLGYGAQKNFAQDLASHDWVLSLDADERVSPELAREIRRRVSTPSACRGFSLPRRSTYLGRQITHGGWYPDRAVRLAHRPYARWSLSAVHEVLEVIGPVSALEHPLDHFPFDSIRAQIETNLNFARLGALEYQRRGGRFNLVLLLCKPIGKFLETYFWKLGCLDGLVGLIIAVNAAHSMFLKFAFLYEDALRTQRDVPPA